LLAVLARQLLARGLILHLPYQLLESFALGAKAVELGLNVGRFPTARGQSFLKSFCVRLLMGMRLAQRLAVCRQTDPHALQGFRKRGKAAL
jgi:hypothetical protein